MIKKVHIFSAITVGLFCLTNFALAQGGIPDPLGGQTFAQVFGKIATAVGGLIAGLATIMFAVSGIFYIMSTANPEMRNTAKKALIYAIVGIVLGLSAQAIVDFATNVTK